MSEESDSSTPDPLPDTFLRLGGVVLGEESVEELLDRVVQLAAAAVPSAHSVSITLTRNGDVYTSNSSGPDALEIDHAQYDGGEGPCLDATAQGTQVEADITDEGGRWPQVRAKAAEFGVQRVLSTPLAVRERTLGALNIYSRAEAEFSDSAKYTASLFAGQAAVLLANALTLMSSVEVTEQLKAALASREIIGEAKGILMQQQTCTRDGAFDVLRRASQRQNRKLREIAEGLVLAVEARARDEAARP
ncbi:MAG: GAF and ANTAR domain-containing protein [Acidimicrobiales bacterium]